MALNGLHLLALLEAPDIPDNEIPGPLVTHDWRGTVREYREMSDEEKDLMRKTICRNVRMRLGKPDPYPELG